MKLILPVHFARGTQNNFEQQQTIRVEFKAKLDSNTATNNTCHTQFTNTKSHIHESNTLIF